MQRYPGLVRWTPLCFRLLTLAGGNFWLKRWADINGAQGKNPDVGKYIGVYFAFGIGGALLVVVQTLILWIFCSIEVRCASEICTMQDASTERKLKPTLYRRRGNYMKGWPLLSLDRR